ncbi:MAG TPA: S26 family signal peptidase [Jatrophihabitans sp.]|uniref:S26 family signal peptidase n=1 Tax=Jatrophihabitans sp. TaxID=1932789 RepID=UPI002F227837
MNRSLGWLGVAGGLSVMGVLLARRWCTVATVRGHSMSPTLLDGQRVLAVRRARYRTGEVIVFWTPDGSGVPGDPDYRVKRVVATGGESRPEMFADSALPAVVPADCLAVAGDNAERSQDSRHLGYIPLTDVLGRVRVRAR